MLAYLAWKAERRNSRSRLCLVKYEHDITSAYITIALAKPYIDAVEWLLQSGNLRITGDVQRYILEPYLKDVGIKNDSGYRYGVRHGCRQDGSRWRYYECGVLHKIGAPASIDSGECDYWQRGRCYRESGPTYVAKGCIMYPPGSDFGMLHCDTASNEIMFRNNISFNRTTRETFIIMCMPRQFTNPRRNITIRNGELHISRGATKYRCAHAAFEHIMEVLSAYSDSLGIASICRRERQRTLGEIAEHCPEVHL